MTLVVPQPTLTQPGATPTRFAADKPITVLCGPVTLPDGSPLTSTNAGTSGFIVLRQSALGVQQAWDDKAKSWVPPVPGPSPQALFPAQSPGPAGRWQAILIGVGQQDAAGADKFASDPATGLPSYAIRCVFAAKSGPAAPQTGASQGTPVAIVPPGQSDRAGFALNTKSPADATQVQVFLKDASLAQQAALTIRASGAAFVLELTASGAAVRITDQGALVLQPAAGQAVTVQGDLAVTGSISTGGQVVVAP